MTIVVLIGSSYNGSISFGHDNLGKNVFLSYFVAFLGVIMTILFCMLITSIDKDLLRLKKYIIWFGRNSFTAMAIHNPIKGFVCIMLATFININSSSVSDNNAYSLVAFIMTMIVTVIGILFVNFVKEKCKSLKC